MNTDDTPTYKIYGADYAIFVGKKANAFRLYTASSNTTSASTASSDGYFFITSTTRTNRGYGFGLWVEGVYYGLQGRTLTAADGVVFTYQKDHVSVTDKLWWYDTVVRASAGNHFLWTDTGPNKGFPIYSRALSDTFQQCIGVIDPSFTIVEFLDSGTVQFSIAVVWDGYNFEAGTQQGYPGEATGIRKATQGLYKVHAGTKTLLKNLKEAATEVWFTNEFDVVAGDSLVIDIKSDANTGGTAFYAIYAYTNTIPGWKEATT